MVNALLTVFCLVVIGMIFVMCCGICLVFKTWCGSSSKTTEIKVAQYKKRGFFRSATCSNEMCAVCLEEFNVSEDINLCPCTHGYHAECLNNWLKVKSACPICQSDLITALGENAPLLRIYTIDV